MQRWIFILLSFVCGYVTSYAIHHTSLFIPEKKWNWCPLEVTKVMVIKTSQEITDAGSVVELCKASMSKTFPVNSKGNFRAILRAQNIKGQVTFLEYDSTQKLFRIESNVFSSAKYESKLTKYLDLY